MTTHKNMLREQEDDPAPDVNDLWTAKELIASLRAEIRLLVEEQEPVEGEHTIFLSVDGEERLLWLYKARKLVQDQSLSMSFEEALQSFVEQAIQTFFELACVEADPAGQIHCPPMA